MQSESKISRKFSDLKVPRYQQVVEALTAEIRSGRYVVGDKIPTEAEQCERFKVSRITIRKAMEQMENDGLISREIGRGTFVRSKEGTNPEANAGGFVMFLLVETNAEDEYNYQEIINTERFLSERDIPFSWASVSEEDLLRGRYPTVLEKRLCSGIIIDGFVNDAHMSLGEQFGAKIVAVGNHDISRHLPQVRSRIRKAIKETLSALAAKGGYRFAMVVEPMKVFFTHEALDAYSASLAENQQDEQMLYLCPQDTPPESLFRLLERSPEPIAVITTEVIYARIVERLAKSAPSAQRPLFVVVHNDHTAKPLPHAYQILPRSVEMQRLAAERLLELVDGRITEVYEELDCEVLEPAD